MLYKIIFPLIFIPIGFSLCFLFNFGIKGMWLGIFLMNIFYILPHSINMYKYYGLFLNQ
jgi:Na+-driven multidrug efflux pump